jgi:hypothetical protein
MARGEPGTESLPPRLGWPFSCFVRNCLPLVVERTWNLLAIPCSPSAGPDQSPASSHHQDCTNFASASGAALGSTTRLHAAMPHIATITRKYASPLLLCFAARAAIPHDATITRQCAWHSRHVLPLGPRCSRAPRLPANAPGTPAVFCRSGSDAPRRHDYPPMRLALQPCFAARAAMPHGATITRQCAWHSRHVLPLHAARPHGAAITRQCVQLLLPSSGARAAMPHGATMTRQCAWPLLPSSGARAAIPHGAAITRECTWLGCRIGQVPRPCKSNLTLPGRA